MCTYIFYTVGVSPNMWERHLLGGALRFLFVVCNSLYLNLPICSVKWSLRGKFTENITDKNKSCNSSKNDRGSLATFTNSPLLNKELSAIQLSYYEHICVSACPCSEWAALVVAQLAGAWRVVAPRTLQLLCDPSPAKATNPAASGGFDNISNFAWYVRVTSGLFLG